MTEAKCIDCGLPYQSFGVDFVLPHSQWTLINPEKDGLLCANCICERVGKLDGAIVLHGVIEFSPNPKTRN